MYCHEQFSRLYFSLSLPSAPPKICQASAKSSPEPVTFSCLKAAPQITCQEALSQRLAWSFWTLQWREACLLSLSPKSPSSHLLGWPVRWNFLSSPPLMMTLQRKQQWHLIPWTPKESHPLHPLSHQKPLPPWTPMSHKALLTFQQVWSHWRRKEMRQALQVVVMVGRWCSRNKGKLHRWLLSYPPRWDLKGLIGKKITIVF